MKAKKLVARVLTLVMALCLLTALAVPAAATAPQQPEAPASPTKNSSGNLSVAVGLDQVKYGVFKFNVLIDKYGTSRGTAFLINDDTIVTAAHCVRFTESEANAYGYTLEEGNKDARYKMAKVTYSVTVERDMTVGATLINYSENMDFAILRLDQTIPTRKYLVLRDSKDVKAAEQVYSVGFPAFYDEQTLSNDYTMDDVTIKAGIISKIQGLTNFRYSSGQECKLDVLSTTCAISGGDSGGPMVDANGNVIGVSIASVTSDVNESFYLASAIDQVIRACDNLGIEYHMAGAEPVPTEPVATTPVVVPVETTAKVEETEAEVEETEAEETEAEEEEEYEEEDSNLTTILIIAAVAVVAVVVVIVIVMSKGKKGGKGGKGGKPSVSGGLNTTGFTGTTNTGSTNSSGFTSININGATGAMGAGETTVLGGDAGATTVLSNKVNGGTLIRKRGNESIVINAERFIIGRERKTANYCISDNSSISRSHVTLSVRNGTTYLSDMNAANGTYVNGVKVMPRQEVALKNGDKITLSDEEFEFKI